jgi:FlaG/FlaF family flagellin (archaellin)
VKINLNQDELETAVLNYIASEGIDLSDKAVTVDFTAGRGEKGISVDVEINEPAKTTSIDNSGITTIDSEEAPVDAEATSLFGS